MKDYVKPEIIEEEIEIEDICGESDVTEYGNVQKMMTFFGGDR